jgi:fluoride ion exporter CrcB/FEX
MTEFPNDPNTLAWLRAVAYTLFASVGGLLGYILHVFEHNKKVDWGMAVVKASTSGFVGVLVLFACHRFQLSMEETGAFVGIAGWLGADTTISIIKAGMTKLFGIKFDEVKHEKSE